MPQGFLLNMLFYATVLWLLICGLFALRRVTLDDARPLPRVRVPKRRVSDV